MAYRILQTAADARDVVADDMIEETLGWFDGERLSTEAFIDRLCHDYGGGGGWDIENYACPAVAEIMRRARKMRAEASL